MNLIIDNQKAIAKWKPVLESLGVQDPYRMKWMAEYAEMHSLNGPVALYRIHGASAMHRLSPQNHLANLLKAASMRWGLNTLNDQRLSPQSFDERLGSVHFDHA